MAVIRYTKQPIEVEIDDAVFGETVVKRKAYFLRMVYNHDSAEGYPGNFGSDGVAVEIKVRLYENGPSGSYGNKLDSKIFADYNQTLTTDPNAYVKANDGSYVCLISDSDADPTLIEGFDVMPENEFFHMLADNIDIKVAPTIHNYILRANTAGKFII